ncbi:hypothetical protein FQA47_008478 [Oryzias melastigma]|uniref:Uncharacterized protein n=1 Tax=Oryzias melastigma TaxID=30732 RepID=A0A834CJY4_ORYME|nr:hypothetical protein FQA47_008478 [Oryzias melastigma]
MPTAVRRSVCRGADPQRLPPGQNPAQKVTLRERTAHRRAELLPRTSAAPRTTPEWAVNGLKPGRGYRLTEVRSGPTPR